MVSTLVMMKNTFEEIHNMREDKHGKHLDKFRHRHLWMIVDALIRFDCLHLGGHIGVVDALAR